MAGGAAPAAGRRPVILVVDDEQDILDSLGLVLRLRLQDVTVLTALSGPEGLVLLQHQRVDAILTDYKMPEMDGFAFVVAARKIHADVPVIMMTAYPDPALAARAEVELGVARFVVKPFDMTDMVRMLRTLAAGEPLAQHEAPGRR